MGGLAVLLCAASIRIPHNPKTPKSRALFSQMPVPSPVADVLRSACADCHSNETVWPWYAHAPVVSLLLIHDVDQARQHLNLSDWTSVREEGPEESAAALSGICENLLSGAMPKPSYTWMHSGARLSKSQISQVCAWTEKQQMETLRKSAAIVRTTRH
jgi:hypothetical protein